MHLSDAVRDYHFWIDLNRLNLKDIKLSYPVYCEISGIVSGRAEVSNPRGANVKGVASAQSFKLAKLEPLDKIADFIGINTIKEISNADIVAEFDLSPMQSRIKHFDLDSRQMRIRSDFTIDNKKWLEGEVALSLPRKILQESKIFKTLLSIARERNDLLDFVVHLSGYMWQMRTELVKSDFRDKLKEKIGVDTQRYIENQANKAIENNN